MSAAQVMAGVAALMVILAVSVLASHAENAEQLDDDDEWWWNGWTR